MNNIDYYGSENNKNVLLRKLRTIFIFGYIRLKELNDDIIDLLNESMIKLVRINEHVLAMPRDDYLYAAFNTPSVTTAVLTINEDGMVNVTPGSPYSCPIDQIHKSMDIGISQKVTGNTIEIWVGVPDSSILDTSGIFHIYHHGACIHGYKKEDLEIMGWFPRSYEVWDKGKLQTPVLTKRFVEFYQMNQEEEEVFKELVSYRVAKISSGHTKILDNLFKMGLVSFVDIKSKHTVVRVTSKDYPLAEKRHYIWYSDNNTCTYAKIRTNYDSACDEAIELMKSGFKVYCVGVESHTPCIYDVENKSFIYEEVDGVLPGLHVELNPEFCKEHKLSDAMKTTLSEVVVNGFLKVERRINTHDALIKRGLIKHVIEDGTGWLMLTNPSDIIIMVENALSFKIVENNVESKTKRFTIEEFDHSSAIKIFSDVNNANKTLVVTV